MGRPWNAHSDADTCPAVTHLMPCSREGGGGRGGRACHAALRGCPMPRCVLQLTHPHLELAVLQPGPKLLDDHSHHRTCTHLCRDAYRCQPVCAPATPLGARQGVAEQALAGSPPQLCRPARTCPRSTWRATCARWRSSATARRANLTSTALPLWRELTARRRPPPAPLPHRPPPQRPQQCLWDGRPACWGTNAPDQYDSSVSPSIARLLWRRPVHPGGGGAGVGGAGA